jgi:sugar phosphate isomerase/epimerase
MLNSIALEPGRWGGDRQPHYTLEDLMKPTRDAGFEAMEIWQFHLTRREMADVPKIKEAGESLDLSFPVVGAYPVFHLEGEEAEEQHRVRMDLLEKAKILDTKLIKMMLGQVKGQEADDEIRNRTASELKRWQDEAKKAGIGLAAELHGGTMFHPEEEGTRFLNDHPELDLGICYQPYDFNDNDEAHALAERFAGRIVHVHLQGRKAEEKGFALLEESAIDYSTLIPKLAKENPGVTFGIEFVKDCTMPAEEFDIPRIADNARRDREFVEKVLP